MTMRRQLVLFFVATCISMQAQSNAAKPQQQAADAHKLPTERGEQIDRIAAIVNGEPILESDLEEEIRFEQLQPLTRLTETGTPNERAMNRLIDRTLILQQEEGFQPAPITDADVDKELTDLRSELPDCAKTDCKSDEGWTKYLADHGFTVDEMRERWRTRMQVLRFIEQRFRAGIRISDKEIEDFYNNTMLPQYAKMSVAPPPLDTLHDRIEQVLLQQHVSALLDDWLKALRETGHVRILKQGEEAP